MSGAGGGVAKPSRHQSDRSKNIADLVERSGHQEALVLVDPRERLLVESGLGSVCGLLPTTFTPGTLPEHGEASASVAHDADGCLAESLPQGVRDWLRLFAGVLVLHVLVHDGLRLYRLERLLHQRDDGESRRPAAFDALHRPVVVLIQALDDLGDVVIDHLVFVGTVNARRAGLLNLLKLARPPVALLYTFGIRRIAIEHGRNVKWLARVADIVGEDARRTHELLELVVADTPHHLVIYLPNAERQEPATLVADIRVVLLPHLDSDLVGRRFAELEKRLVSRVLLVHVREVVRVLRLAPVVGADLPHQVRHVRERHKVVLAQAARGLLVDLRGREADPREVRVHDRPESRRLHALTSLRGDGVVPDRSPVVDDTEVPVTNDVDLQLQADGAEERRECVGRDCSRAPRDEPVAAPLEGQGPKTIDGVAGLEYPERARIPWLRRERRTFISRADEQVGHMLEAANGLVPVEETFDPARERP